MEIHPKDMGRFVKHQKHMSNKIYKTVFSREEKMRAKDGKGFYFEEYIEHPERFESNLDKYLPHFKMLIHTSYWDKKYPRLVSKDMLKRLYSKNGFRLEFIGDISCDINGSIEPTCKVMTPELGVYTYDPDKDVCQDGCESNGVAILAVDNLPAELPRDSSEHFSGLIRDYVYQIAVHGARDITEHAALPVELRNAVITQDGSITDNFRYLEKYID